MDTTSTATVGRTYTRGRRQPYLIRKWPGSNWALPMGPYTITQMLVFVGSIYLLLSYRDAWAHFGPFNLVIGAGIPVLLTYATRHTRVEGRDPLRAGIALASLLTQPRSGYLNGAPWRAARPRRVRSGRIPMAPLPAGLVPPAQPVGATTRPRVAVSGRWVADLVADAAGRPGAGGDER